MYDRLFLIVFAEGPVQKMSPMSKLEIAVKCGAEVLYFSTDVPFHVLLAEDGRLGMLHMLHNMSPH